MTRGGMGMGTFNHSGWPLPASAVAVLGLAAAAPASATGFFINQQSVQGLGRVGAGNSAAAEDLGTIFFNPAGLTRVVTPEAGTGLQLSLGAHLVVPRTRQRNSGSTIATPATLGQPVPYQGGDSVNPTEPTPVPNLYVARSLLQGRAALGLGLNAPFGLATDSGADWFGRYDAIEASLRTINMAAVGAYRFDSGLSIGGGLDLQYARVTLGSAIPNPFLPTATPATDGRIALKGHDWSPGFHVGLLLPLSADQETRIGLHYRSGITHRIHGAASVTGLPGPLAIFNGAPDVRAQLKLPAVAALGLRTRLDARFTLLGEIEWYDWSRFREIRIRFADGRPDAVRPARYRDAWAAAVGLEHRASNVPLTWRGGIRYDTTPTTNAWRDTLVPDSPRLWLGLGASYEASPTTSVHLAFNHVRFHRTDVALTRTFFDGTPQLESRARINAAVKSSVNTVAVELQVAF